MKTSINVHDNESSSSEDNGEVNSTNNSHQEQNTLNNNTNDNTSKPQPGEELSPSNGITRSSQGRITDNNTEIFDTNSDAEASSLNNNCVEVSTTTKNNNNNNNNNNESKCNQNLNSSGTLGNKDPGDRSSYKQVITDGVKLSLEEIKNGLNLGKCSGEQNVHLACSSSTKSICPANISQDHATEHDNLSASDSYAEINSKVNRALSLEDDEYSTLLRDDESKLNQTKDFIKDTPVNDESFPEYLQTLLEGQSVCGDSYIPFSKPDWLDMDKFRRGQQFAVNHIFGVMYAELISLIMLFTLKNGVEPLVFTGRSDTPFKAFKRYLSTVVRVRSWYDEDIWDEHSQAHKNLKVVRAMHEATRKGINSCPKEEITKRVTLEGNESQQPLLTDLRNEILDDFRASCPMLKASMARPNETYVNQMDMGMTQFGFAGLIIAYPKMFGIHWASNEDLDGFVHFWRTIGYLLGTEDRFNFCAGDLQTVQQRSKDIIEFWVKPKFRSVSPDWLHMSRCVFIGVSFYVPTVSFEVMLLYLCRVLDIEAFKLKASLTFWQYASYLQTVILYSFTLRLPGMWALHNWLIDRVVKKAQNMSPERMQKLEQRVYPREANS